MDPLVKEALSELDAWMNGNPEARIRLKGLLRSISMKLYGQIMEIATRNGHLRRMCDLVDELAEEAREARRKQ